MLRTDDRIRLPILALAALMLAPIAAKAQEAKPTAAPFDLAMVPKDAPVVIAFRPAALLKRPDLKAIYEEMTRPDEVKRVVDVVEPETIEQITLVLLSRELPNHNDPGEAMARAGAIFVRTNKAREWKALAAAGGLPLVKATHGGKDYFKLGGDSAGGFGFYQPDENSLVLATETNLQKLMDGDKADAQAKPRWSASSFKDATPIAVAAIDFAWARALIDPQVKNNPEAALGLSVIGPIWDKTESLVLSVSADDRDGLTLTSEHACSDEAGATGVAKTLDAFLTLGRNVAPQAVRTLREQARGNPVASDLADLADQALKSASVSRQGSRVSLTVSAKADVARIAKEISRGR